MNHTIKYIRTDFGDRIYDEWYLTHDRYNFESSDFVCKHIPFYETVLSLTQHDKILDPGCGIGSYTREFNRQGYHIAGIDLSEHFLTEARVITKNEELDIEYILGDYNEMSFEEEYSVIFFEGSFFYKSEDALIKLLSRIYNALKPNGRLYFVHRNQEIIKKEYPWTKQTEIEKNVFFHQNAEYDEESEGEKHTWLKLDYNTNVHFKCEFFVMCLNPIQLQNCLIEVGFGIVQLYK